MAIHKPTDRHFFTIGGAVQKRGGSLGLAKGVFGIFDYESQSVRGMKAVEDFAALTRDSKVVMKLGKSSRASNRSYSNKSFSTFPFEVGNIQKLSVSAPERTEQAVDEVVVGYNGITEGTSFQFKQGESHVLRVEISGGAVDYLGTPYNKDVAIVHMGTDQCDPYGSECVDCQECEDGDCAPIVRDAVTKLRRFPMKGDMKLEDFVEITPIISCPNQPEIQTSQYNFYKLQVVDTGDQTSMAAVEAQYPDVKIERTSRMGLTSVYKFGQPASEAAPEAFERTLASIIKGCEDCPEGYAEVEGGFVYAIALEDDGSDQSSDIEVNFADVVAGTIIKSDSQNFGVGYYTLVATKEITAEELSTFMDAQPTATVEFVAETSSLCDPQTSESFEWTEDGSCEFTQQDYVIDLPDGECGQDRLQELQEAYPELEISLEGTTGGCQTRYKTTTYSNLVCEECDPIFEDFFATEAPTSYENRMWRLEGPDLNGSATEEEPCKCGIRIKGKLLEIHPDNEFRDTIGFEDRSVKIQVSGGHLREVLGTSTQVDAPFHVEYLSYAKPRTHMGGDFYSFERRSWRFFEGEMMHDDRMARQLLGEESHLESGKQYVDYAITVRRDIYAQAWGQRQEDNITYHVIAEVGKHQDVEEVLNKLAQAAGVSPVRAFAR